MEQTQQKTERADIVLDRLEAMLETQAEMARQSNFRKVQKLAAQIDPIIAEIADRELYLEPGYKSRLETISKRFQQLHLILSTHKDLIAKQLGKIGKGKKTIQAYRPRN